MTNINASQRQRTDTAENWASSNRVLLLGEIGIEIDTGRLKIGDGSTAWTGLEYFKAPSVGPLASPAGLDMFYDSTGGGAITAAIANERIYWYQGFNWVSKLINGVKAHVVADAGATLLVGLYSANTENGLPDKLLWSEDVSTMLDTTADYVVASLSQDRTVPKGNTWWAVLGTNVTGSPTVTGHDYGQQVSGLRRLNHNGRTAGNIYLDGQTELPANYSTHTGTLGSGDIPTMLWVYS